jgi:hypothetical protein
MHPSHFFDEPVAINPPRPNPEMRALARLAIQDAGLPRIRPTPYVEVNPRVARLIAETFDALPNAPDDPAVAAAYAALVAAVDVQFAVVEDALDLTTFDDHDPNPYPTSEAMFDDLWQNRHLAVYTGGARHPALTADQNWRFRAVHDVFGHAANGFAFGPRGEENAWLSHAKMFAPQPRAAMTTETRGQNAWVNFGPFSDLPPHERPFAQQKALLLPPPFRTHPVLQDAYADVPGFVA